MYFYHAEQDRRDERGTTPDAHSGALRNLSTGETWNGAILAENRFHYGRLSIVPGMRLEFLDQSLEEDFNVAKTEVGEPLASIPISTSYRCSASAWVSSWSRATRRRAGSAAGFTASGPARLEFYGTVAQAYRPIAYAELVPTGASTVVNDDLREGDALQYEAGLRGVPLPYLTFDLGGFYFTFEDQVGDISLPGGLTSTGNIGDARYYGLEAAAELDVLALINGGPPSPYGMLVPLRQRDLARCGVHFRAERRQYADLRSGLSIQDRRNLSIRRSVQDRSSRHVRGRRFGDANNSFERGIPDYQVWDLTARSEGLERSHRARRRYQNLFNEDYWGEVREEGIVPAYRRNYYGGVELFF